MEILAAANVTLQRVRSSWAQSDRNARFSTRNTGVAVALGPTGTHPKSSRSPGQTRDEQFGFQAVDDADVATSVSAFSDYQLWGAYYGGEGEMLEGSEEGLEGPEKGEQEDVDAMTLYQDKTAEKKAKSRQSIGIAKDKDASEETLITPEEISVISLESSRESSTHPCLLDIEISDSQLKLQNMYTMYPIPDDPGLVPAFWTTHEHPAFYPDDGVARFFDLANILKVQPIRTVGDMLLSDKISLQYYGLNPRVIRPLCEALMDNPLVQSINLTENWLSEDACYHLNEVLLRNQNVSTLLLAGCRIGAIGAARLRGGISNSTTLTTLDLSECDIRKEGLEHVVEAVCSNSSLESLSLNDNHLDESCADDLQKLLSCSKTLQGLKLAWNSLYTADTWRRLGRGLLQGEALVDLDLSWNALGRECAPHLRQLLARSPSLTKLRLTGNRFYNEDAVVIARGLSRNQVLRELYLGNNPLKGAGALALAQAVTPERSPQSQLEVLDLTNVWADKDILPILEAIETERPGLDVRLGGILSNYKVVGPDVQAILLKRAIFEAMKAKNRRRRRNFGHFVLSLTDNPITKGRFTELVRQFGMRLSKSLLDEIIKAFPGEKNRVDQELLKSVYMTQYPNTRPPPERPAKKKKDKGKKKKKGKAKIKRKEK